MQSARLTGTENIPASNTTSAKPLLLRAAFRDWLVMSLHAQESGWLCDGYVDSTGDSASTFLKAIRWNTFWSYKLSRCPWFLPVTTITE